MSVLSPFHLAIPVDNLETNGRFYRDILGFKEGRSSEHWIDFDFFGHQLVLHEQKNPEKNSAAACGNVDGKQVPIPHFGVVLSWTDFHKFADHLKMNKISFIIEPCVRFQGETGEQSTMFFHDPSGNSLEFKAFKNIDQLFAK